MDNLGPKYLLELPYGIKLTESVVHMWIVMAILIVFSLVFVRNFQKVPGKMQNLIELIVDVTYSQVNKVMGPSMIGFAPYIGTLFIFVLFGNFLGLLGIRPITSDVNTTFALGTITFFLIHVTSLKRKGLKGYLKHLSGASIVMLPMNVISELVFPISLSFRLFGNITGGVIILTLAYTGLDSLSAMLGLPVSVFGFLIPIPLNAFFDVFEGVLQAFIFAMLTMTFIAMGSEGGEEH
ncbi:MAG: F0F1 ATP synthase subunit A [Eubacteriales bacterium]